MFATGMFSRLLHLFARALRSTRGITLRAGLVAIGLHFALVIPERQDRQSALSLRLNLPAYRLDVLRDAQIVRRYSVAIGATGFRTPVGVFDVKRVVWNPWWYPPPARWARDEKITPPGPDNPMGKVKILIGGAYYLHGTPFPSSIGKAASHGCLRMHNDDAIDLARLLQSESGALIAAAATDSLASALNETRIVELPTRIPIRVVYELVEVRGDTLEVFPDVYRGRYGSASEHAFAALPAAGHDTTRLDRVALKALIRKAKRHPARTLVDSLMLHAPIS